MNYDSDSDKEYNNNFDETGIINYKYNTYIPKLVLPIVDPRAKSVKRNFTTIDPPYRIYCALCKKYDLHTMAGHVD